MNTDSVDRSAARPGALAIIREGRLIVTNARERESCFDPFVGPEAALVLIRSSRDANRLYAVDVTAHGIYCSCGRHDCAHAYAARLVTGGPV